MGSRNQLFSLENLLHNLLDSATLIYVGRHIERYTDRQRLVKKIRKIQTIRGPQKQIETFRDRYRLIIVAINRGKDKMRQIETDKNSYKHDRDREKERLCGGRHQSDSAVS